MLKNRNLFFFIIIISECENLQNKQNKNMSAAGEAAYYLPPQMFVDRHLQIVDDEEYFDGPGIEILQKRWDDACTHAGDLDYKLVVATQKELDTIEDMPERHYRRRASSVIGMCLEKQHTPLPCWFKCGVYILLVDNADRKSVV